MIYSCTDNKSYEELCLFVDHCLILLNTYRFLTESYILEFFVDRQWNLIPGTWRNSLETLKMNDIYDLMANKQVKYKILPLSLLCYRKCAEIYKFDNKQSNDQWTKVNNVESNSKPTAKVSINKICPIERCDIAIKNEQIIKLKPELSDLMDKHLNRNLTPKKIHEINKLSNVIHSLVNIDCKLYDVGSGLGFLSRRLAFKFKFSKIISVDCDTNLLMKAVRLDDKLCKELKWLDCHLKPNQLNYTINRENYDQILTVDNNDIDTNFGLIGLHTCGNLSHYLLELHKNSKSKHLFLCSCCYHKTRQDGYLISEHLKNTKICLTVETRANACHSLDNFIDSLKNKPGELRTHTYRALLEQLLELKSPSNRKRTLNKVSNLTSKTFYEYVECVLKKQSNIIDELDLNSRQINEIIQLGLSQNLKVITFYALRTLLGPVCESVLLADRMLFLYENKQIKSKLVPLFDPQLSPRNFLLISSK